MVVGTIGVSGFGGRLLLFMVVLGVVCKAAGTMPPRTFTVDAAAVG